MVFLLLLIFFVFGVFILHCKAKNLFLCKKMEKQMFVFSD